MTEKRALVTGGGTRLGRAMALYLAHRGHDVAVHYNASADGAEAVVSEIVKSGRAAQALQADLLDAEATFGLVPAAAEALGGPLNVLINSASIYERDRLATVTPESWRRHIDSNLRAPVFLTQCFAAQAPRAPRDHDGDPVPQALVVNILDSRVARLSPDHCSYTLAKMGLAAFTTTAAQELAPDICVNAIGPGWTLPDAGQEDDDFLRVRASVTPGRGPRPEDICAALGYFLDAPATTGQTILVDGGQSIDWAARRKGMRHNVSHL